MLFLAETKKLLFLNEGGGNLLEAWLKVGHIALVSGEYTMMGKKSVGVN